MSDEGSGEGGLARKRVTSAAGSDTCRDSFKMVTIFESWLRIN